MIGNDTDARAVDQASAAVGWTVCGVPGGSSRGISVERRAVRTAPNTATPKAPPIRRKKNMQATPTPPSRGSSAFWTATVIGENWQPKASPSASVTAVSSGSERPSPTRATTRHISVATEVPSSARKRYRPVRPTACPARKLPLTLPSVIAIIRSPASRAERPETSW